jgi:hypothetical protein
MMGGCVLAPLLAFSSLSPSFLLFLFPLSSSLRFVFKSRFEKGRARSERARQVSSQIDGMDGIFYFESLISKNHVNVSEVHL